MPKIGSFRLPAHSRDAHRNFFDDPYFFRNEILTIWEQIVPLGSNGLNKNLYLSFSDVLQLNVETFIGISYA